MNQGKRAEENKPKMNINQKTVDKHRETRENIYRRTILIDILNENDKNTTQKIIIRENMDGETNDLIQNMLKKQENIEEVKKAKDVMENIERWEWQNPVLMNNDGIPN